MNLKTITVSQLNAYIKNSLDGDSILNNVTCDGEIANYTDRGHLYFTLKDETSKIDCIMYQSNASRMKDKPKVGEKVKATGKVSMYFAGGKLQFIVNSMELFNEEGILYKKFEELKAKLDKNGLLKDEIKKPIPKAPGKIALITSPTGAAVRDVIKTAKNRNASQRIVIYPATVQGDNAASEVMSALDAINRRNDIDVIIIARGGGSIEDLWCFNSEELAYAIRASKIPVVTGIGHEPDITIADLVADHRSSTPTQAALFTVPDMTDKHLEVEKYRNNLNSFLKSFLLREKDRIAYMERIIKGQDPRVKLANVEREISIMEDRFRRNIKIIMDKAVREKERSLSLLKAFNPLNVLNKGYSIIRDEDSRVLKTVEEIKRNDVLDILLSDGEILIKKEVLRGK